MSTTKTLSSVHETLFLLLVLLTSLHVSGAYPLPPKSQDVQLGLGPTSSYSNYWPRFPDISFKSKGVYSHADLQDISPPVHRRHNTDYSEHETMIDSSNKNLRGSSTSRPPRVSSDRDTYSPWNDPAVIITTCVLLTLWGLFFACVRCIKLLTITMYSSSAQDNSNNI